MISVRTAALGLALSVVAVTGASAQDEITRVAVHDDWSVFETDAGGKECWIASAPQTSTASRNGSTVQVRRGKIRLMVSNRPGQDIANEVSYTGGYPFREGSTVTVNVGGSQFEFDTAGEWAWPSSAADDQRAVAAMRAGSDAQVTGTSSRGTTTVDTVSLIGFTAALEDASSRCSG
ncbi:invasion associated locus B family protein [Roseobacter sp. HKCCA0434]|uniref:invasion associated locus B family protein n=1 Tax=Roseobacter sp. HKCCA0434 TaxID=3079297 RepID=UPI002905F426|nr:invasion associated locus B family protein [Roseobacter sp. HKCCA0434]